MFQGNSLTPYKRIVISICCFNSFRMLIGAVSAVYMLQAGVSLTDIAYMKAFQAIMLMLLSFIAGSLADSFDRKKMCVIALYLSGVWLSLMFLGGIWHSVKLFYLSEAINSLSLVILQNISNAYLLDQYQQDYQRKDLEKPLGLVNQYSFLGMACLSFIGAITYKYIQDYLFISAGLLLFATGLCSQYALPSQRVSTHSHHNSRKNSHQISIDKMKIYLIYRKLIRHKNAVVSMWFLSVYSQVIIQYWQIISEKMSKIVGKPFWLGIIMMTILMAQSLAGKIARKGSIMKSSLLLYTGLLLSLIFWYFSLKLDNLFAFLVSIALFFFLIRLAMILLSADVHRYIRKKIRARFDGTFNTITRLLTVIAFIVLGKTLERLGVYIIILSGIMPVIIMLLQSLIAWMRRNKYLNSVQMLRAK